MATEIIRYVNTAAASGGNGVTNAESGPDRAYDSLQAALFNGWDLVAADERVIIQCSVGSGSAADQQTGGTSMSGWTTDADHYVTVIAAPGEEATMPWDETRYRYEHTPTGSGNKGTGLSFFADYTELWNLQIGHEIVHENSWATICWTRKYSQVWNCVFRHTYNNALNSTAGSNACIAFFQLGTTVGEWARAYNCAAYGRKLLAGNGPRIIGFTGSAFSDIIYYNCGVGRFPTVAVDALGYNTPAPQGDVWAYNCYSILSDDAGSDFDASVLGDYNLSKDASAIGPNSRINQTPIFLDAANGDLHLDMIDTAARGRGQSFSELFTTDVDGDARAGLWDIGPDQATAIVVQTYPDVASVLPINRRGHIHPKTPHNTPMAVFIRGAAISTHPPDNVRVIPVAQWNRLRIRLRLAGAGSVGRLSLHWINELGQELGVGSRASDYLELTGNAGNNETVTLGGEVYTFQTTLTDVDKNVLIGATARESLENLAAAINTAPGAGTIYAASTTPNPLAYAVVKSQAARMHAYSYEMDTGLGPITTGDTLANGAWNDGGGTLVGMANNEIAANTTTIPGTDPHILEVEVPGTEVASPEHVGEMFLKLYIAGATTTGLTVDYFDVIGAMV